MVEEETNSSIEVPRCYFIIKYKSTTHFFASDDTINRNLKNITQKKQKNENKLLNKISIIIQNIFQKNL